MRRPSGNLKLCVDANMQAVSGGVPMPRQQLFWGFENWADLANCGRYVQSSFTSLESSGEFLDGVCAKDDLSIQEPSALDDFLVFLDNTIVFGLSSTERSRGVWLSHLELFV